MSLLYDSYVQCMRASSWLKVVSEKEGKSVDDIKSDSQLWEAEC